MLKIAPDLVGKPLEAGVCVHVIGPLLLWVLPYCLSQEEIPGYVGFSLPQPQNQPPFQGSLILCSGKWYLETKMWALSVFTGVSGLPSPVSAQGH